METAVFMLILAVLAANCIARHSGTGWWRDPAGPLRSDGGPPDQPHAEPAPVVRGESVARVAEPMAPRRSPEVFGREFHPNGFPRAPHR